MADRERTARGAGDADLHARVAKAVRAAMSILGTGAQSEVARRTGITQPEISKIARGQRPTTLNLWEMIEIERATGRPHGFILREMKYLPEITSARDAIMSSPDLDATGRAIVLAAYDAAADGVTSGNPGKKAPVPTRKARS
jgi:transcriptional regulator with XRE-family HTH domain